MNVHQMADNLELFARRALDDRPAARRALAWYDDVAAWAAELARQHGLPKASVLGALAALSPQVSWTNQLKFFPLQLGDFLAKHTLRGPGFGKNRAKAQRILFGEKPLDVLGGLKVRAFYLALSGELGTSGIVIDRHAIAAAWNGTPHPNLTDGIYKEAAQAHTIAAAVLGLDPVRLQALVWEWWRLNRAPSAQGGTL